MGVNVDGVTLFQIRAQKIGQTAHAVGNESSRKQFVSHKVFEVLKTGPACIIEHVGVTGHVFATRGNGRKRRINTGLSLLDVGRRRSQTGYKHVYHGVGTVGKGIPFSHKRIFIQRKNGEEWYTSKTSMVTLGDLIRFRASDRQGLTHVGEVVGKRRVTSSGKRVYDVYGLEPVPGSRELYRYKSDVEEVPTERVFVRVHNNGNYREAWSKLGWKQMGQGEKSVFSLQGQDTVVPDWGLEISDSEDASTDDSSSSASEYDDVEMESVSMNTTDLDYEPSVEETDSESGEDPDPDILQTPPGVPADLANSLRYRLTDDERDTLFRMEADADRAFREWVPETPGERRFKDTISRIETRVRQRSNRTRS